MHADRAYYDPDEDVRPSSPPLVPIPVNYKPEKTPPQYIPTSSSSGSVSPAPGRVNDRPDFDTSAYTMMKKYKKRRKKRRTRPSQGDAVLISYLEPNRPDIAQEAAQRALNSASQSEAGDELEEDRDGGAEDGENYGGTEEKHRDSAHATELRSTAWAALRDVDTEPCAPGKPVIASFLAMPKVLSGIMPRHSSNGDDATDQARLTEACEPADAPGSLHPPLPLKVLVAPSEGNCDGGDESITTSPALAKFAISAAEANPESTLPALQKSPKRLTSNHSPGGTQSLPSLQMTLNQIADTPIVETPTLSPFPQHPGPSPTLTRSPYPTGTAGPSPTVYSQSSRSSSKDMTNTASPGFSNHSSHWHKPLKEASNGSFTSNTFKCTHPGCTAQPFQTQYLLNSHANVHSSDRPHYCPEKSCSRSINGKGFKRKNEMKRHGLVHKSPGYACPFCAELQHKYPRPDNLQRHVKGHHPDKGLDDPELRSVLALKSGDGYRGRRRRGGA